MSVISFASGEVYSVEQTLAVLDDLRDSIARGDTIAFAAVGLYPDSTCARWTAAARVVSPLLMAGAIANLQHFYIADAED